MIVLITTRFRGRTLRSLMQGTFGVPTPRLRTVSYERLFGAWRVPRATYIFSDLERLSPWELRLAAGLYRSMTAVGLRCLNDPARAMGRVEMLTALHRAGINPFSASRADADPRPRRFPVFLRNESDHQAPSDRLYYDQQQLDEGLRALREGGIPLRGVVVVEVAAEPYRDDLWAKWGSWRIGDQYIVEHIAVDGTWLVKTGDHAKITPEIAADEHEAVMSNRFAGSLAPAFDLAGIEYGRADHAMLNGRTIVFEINTNPYIGHYVPAKNSPQGETRLYARSRIADAFAEIDTASGGSVTLPDAQKRQPIRWWRPGFVSPRRP